ncbi:MAG TPA: hypothetical protein VLG37_05660 [Candidatus Saccharimonadales bacterium]|nr:hypothetical protein [Candidatus Saccharimonadales bacterium]
MKHFTIETIDYSRYKPRVRIQVVGGSRPRITLVHSKTNQKFIFKTYSHNSREVWAECLASHLGMILGVPVQQVVIKRAPTSLVKALKENVPENLPHAWKPIGTLARNIFPKDQEIMYGAKIVGTNSDALSLEKIEMAIRAQYYAADDLLERFAQMIVFDAIIGNMDRHHENWGIVESIKYKQQVMFGKKTLASQRGFTPLYDHGSSLLFELSEENIERYLSDKKTLRDKYIFGSKYSFVRDSSGTECNVFDVIRDHIREKTDWGKRFRKAILPLPKASRLEIAKAITKMPSAPEIDYSEERKELLLRSILLRLEALIEMVQ